MVQLVFKKPLIHKPLPNHGNIKIPGPYWGPTGKNICLCQGMEDKKDQNDWTHHKVKLQFDLSSYNKLQSEMVVIEKQIITI